MGQYNSTVNMARRYRRKSLRSLPDRSSRTNISATFTMNDEDQKVELLNINLATEEELMTLPGITRSIAHNIVEHRKAIGRYRKVEDLALVKGIGADKLDKIRFEVCINKRRNQSCASSRAQSLDSLDSRVPIRTNKLLDINKANVFELQGIHGISQEVAANIIQYRIKKGPFVKLDDLLRVKGMDHLHFGNVNTFLTINSEVESDSLSIKTVNDVTNGKVNGGPNSNAGSRKPIKQNMLGNGLPYSSAYDIFELLSAYSNRPIPEEDFNYTRNGLKAARIATWNVNELSLEKAQNFGVLEVLCRTILENRWSIIAMQEVRNVEALKILCDELNKPVLRKVAEWKDNSRKWNFCIPDETSSQLGFIYDSDSKGLGVCVSSISQICIADCEAMLVDFKVGDVEVTVLNVYLPNFGSDDIEQTLHHITTGSDDMILVMGDFSGIYENTELGTFEALLPLSTNTSCVSTKSSASPRFCDNIFSNLYARSQLTGMWGVIRQGLTHLAIPWGWSWGGPVSSHSPVWTEIYASPSIGTAL